MVDQIPLVGGKAASIGRPRADLIASLIDV